MKKIKLGKKNLFTIIDDDDFGNVSKHGWSVTTSQSGSKKHMYANATINKKNVRLHRFLTNCPSNMVVDHKNGDGLDNRRSNLRVCTHRQNLVNSDSRNKTGYKGVCFFNGVWRKKRYMAKMSINGKTIRTKYFLTAKEAAQAYNKIAKKVYGEFAKLNSMETF